LENHSQSRPSPLGSGKLQILNKNRFLHWNKGNHSTCTQVFSTVTVRLLSSGIWRRVVW